jgi:hypothetical protein
LAVLLFFVSSVGWTAPEGATEIAPAAQLSELQLAVQALRQQNDELRQTLQQRDAQLRVLSEDLAIARTESELFQRRWAEAQLRAQTLGVNFADADTKQWQRQIIETVRSLYLAEAERQRLLEQFRRLIAAVESGQAVSAAVAVAKNAVVLSEQPGEPRAARREVGSLEAAQLVDVNRELRVAVVNVGLEQGARVGMPLVVLRDDRVIAELRIVEVRRNIAGALIGSEDKAVAIQAGDEARVMSR